MDDNFSIALSDNKEEQDYVLKRLKEFNRETVPSFPREIPYHLIAKDEKGKVIGGIRCLIHWDWLKIELLWVDDDYRGKSIGSSLMRQAEQEALKHNTPRAYVETADFQALDFYQKEGYKVFGEADNMPVGHKCFWLKHEQLDEKHS